MFHLDLLRKDWLCRPCMPPPAPCSLSTQSQEQSWCLRIPPGGTQWGWLSSSVLRAPSLSSALKWVGCLFPFDCHSKAAIKKKPEGLHAEEHFQQLSPKTQKWRNVVQVFSFGIQGSSRPWFVIMHGQHKMLGWILGILNHCRIDGNTNLNYFLMVVM